MGTVLMTDLVLAVRQQIVAVVVARELVIAELEK